MTPLDPINLKAPLLSLGPLNMSLDPNGSLRSSVVPHKSIEDPSTVSVDPLDPLDVNFAPMGYPRQTP